MTDRKPVNAALIGEPRSALNTPALVIERDVLERNIARMADFARDHGLALRPHAKTHKSLDIAKLQIGAGAAGICCAKLGEAEALTASGEIVSVLITSPVTSAPAISRLAALNKRIDDLRVVVDHPGNAAALAEAVGDGKPLSVLIDIDPGIHRTGVTDAEAAVRLAQRIAQQPALTYRGVQFYCGVQQHVEGFEARRTAIAERTGYLETVIAALADAGHPPAIVSGGGTGTHAIDAELGVLTELQAGSYVFMDRQYDVCELTENADNFETSLFVDTRIVSCNTPGMATLDAGFKSLSTDGDKPVVKGGAAPEDAAFFFMGDEHGALAAAGWQGELGAAVSLQVPHCDPTVNLYDYYHVVENGQLAALWPVTARGCNF